MRYLLNAKFTLLSNNQSILLFKIFFCYQVSDKDLQTMYVEANFFTLASHIYWGLWALIQVLPPSV